MNKSHWRWRSTFVYFCFLVLSSVECRRYDKCSTHGGRTGVCVVKRYCRETTVASLQACDGGDTYCCPLPTTSKPSPESPPSTNTRGEEEPEKKGRDNADDGQLRPPLSTGQRPSSEDRPKPRGERTREPLVLDKAPRRELGGSRDGEDAEQHRKMFGEEDDAPQRRPPPTSHSSRDDDSRPKRPPPQSSWDEEVIPDRDPLPKYKPKTPRPTFEDTIHFPGSYETSVHQPKVPDCGVKPYELFIAGGEESEEHEWPWMTAIFRRHQGSKPKTFLCGGSLINTRYVLTAAHCFVNNYVIQPASNFVVRLGSHYLDSGEEYTVSQLSIHSNHSGSDFFNDIALVRLASEVYVTDKIAPVCLPLPTMLGQDLVGRVATVAGWGDTAFRTSGTRILQHVVVPIVSSEDCFAAYSRVKGAAFLAKGSDHVVCAGLREGGKDACLGDSGGPLMLKTKEDRWVVVGIVSLGYKCAEPGYPGVYTRVTHYMNWIQSKMKRHY